MKKKIKKVADNAVVVTEILYEDKKAGAKEYVLSTEEYGQKRIDENRVHLEAQLAWFNNSTNIQAKIDKITAELTELDDIQTEMDK